jgi:hypothetical protein
MDPRAKTAEELVAAHLRRRFERYGMEEAARNLPHHLKVDLVEAREEGDLTRYTFDAHLRIGAFAVSLNAVDGSSLGWSFPLLAEAARGDREVPAETALAAAAKAGAPPEGAVLASAGYETIAGERFFVARWEHVEGGARVERDFVQVTVNGSTGRPFSVSRRWHTVDFEPSER